MPHTSRLSARLAMAILVLGLGACADASPDAVPAQAQAAVVSEPAYPLPTLACGTEAQPCLLEGVTVEVARDGARG